MITEDFVSFELAKLLKEKGFDGNTFYKYADKEGVIEEWYDDYRERMLRFDLDEGCLIKPLAEPQDKYRVYGDTIPAPSLALAMKWLREVHKICIVVQPVVTDDDGSGGCLWIFTISKRLKLMYKSEVVYERYEQACEAAIKYCLENLI